jgi:hypothetical protein
VGLKADGTVVAVGSNEYSQISLYDWDLSDTSDQECDTLYYQDADGDGYGDADASVTACDPPEGYVSDSSDCNDDEASVSPGSTETDNDVDDNCDGRVDEGFGDAPVTPSGGTAGSGDGGGSSSGCFLSATK